MITAVGAITEPAVPNEPNAILKTTSECPNPSRNAIRFARFALENVRTHKSLSVKFVFVYGVTILDSNEHSVGELLAILKEVKDLPKEMQTIAAFLIDDAIADPASCETLRGILKPRLMVLRSAVKFDKVGDASVGPIGHGWTRSAGAAFRHDSVPVMIGIAGEGDVKLVVYSSSLASMTSTPLAASTSSVVAAAGTESTCVSMPRNSGPSNFLAFRYRQTA